MSIPLVQNNEKDSINTSIIAIKKNLERINSLLGLVDSSEPDLSGLATKQELEDAVTEINNTVDEVETSLQPVDTVTSGDMHSVTSNAVSGLFKLLWNNSSPDTDISTTSIPLPAMGNYSMLLVVINWATYSLQVSNQQLLIIGQSSNQLKVSFYDSSGNIYECVRNITIADNQINIGVSALYINGVRNSQRDDICIPVRIYGIK